MSAILDRADAIERILSDADRLGVFPAVAARIREVAADADASMVDLEDCVSLDPTLSAQILKLANSPFYGLNRTVGSLRHALMILGFRATRDLAMSLVVLRLTQDKGDVHQRLWSEGLRTGVAARSIARHVRWADPGEAFVTGILHDLGKLILLAVDDDGYREMLLAFLEDDDGLLEQERRAFGVTHTDLGAACLARWDLPERLSIAVAHHYDPMAIAIGCREHFRLAGLIWTAEAVVEGLEAHRSFHALATELSGHAICRELGLSKAVVTDVIVGFSGALADTERTL